MTKSSIPINGKKLAARWDVETVDLLYIMLNHGFNEVDKFYNEVDIEDVLEDFKEKKDASIFMFSLSEVKDIEAKLGVFDEIPHVESIRGKDLMVRWNIHEGEVFSIMINNGLAVIDPFGYELDSNRIYSLLYNNTLDLSDLLFRPSDIKKFESEHPEIVAEQVDRKNINKDRIVGSEQPRALHPDNNLNEPQNAFWYNGDFWEVRFNGEKTTLKNLTRLRYIVCLLAKPNKFYKVTELEDIVNKVNVLGDYEKEISEMNSQMEKEQSQMNEEQSHMGSDGFNKDYDLKIGELSSSKLTPIEFDSLRKMATSIWGDLRAAMENNTNIEPAQKRWEECKKHLFNEHGIVAFIGKKRHLNFVVKRRPTEMIEKLRLKITTQIKNSIDDINKKIPSLASYLSRNIERGTSCVYKPDPLLNIKWDIRWNYS